MAGPPPSRRGRLDNPGVFEEVHREVDAESFWDTSLEPDEPVRAFQDTHGAAWIDFDSDGDQDLTITTGVCCDPQFFVNDGGRLYYRTQDWGFGGDIDRAGRSSIWYDDDGDRVLEMAFITTYTASWLDPMAGRFVEAVGADFNCSRSMYAVEVDLTGDDALEMLCVFTGGDFAGSGMFPPDHSGTSRTVCPSCSPSTTWCSV